MGRYCQKSVAESAGSEKNIKRRGMAIYGELSIEGGGGVQTLCTLWLIIDFEQVFVQWGRSDRNPGQS